MLYSLYFINPGSKAKDSVLPIFEFFRIIEYEHYFLEYNFFKFFKSSTMYFSGSSGNFPVRFWNIFEYLRTFSNIRNYFRILQYSRNVCIFLNYVQIF